MTMVLVTSCSRQFQSQKYFVASSASMVQRVAIAINFIATLPVLKLEIYKFIQFIQNNLLILLLVYACFSFQSGCDRQNWLCRWNMRSGGRMSERHQIYGRLATPCLCFNNAFRVSFSGQNIVSRANYGWCYYLSGFSPSFARCSFQ